MPINPSPEYKQAEASYRAARDAAERLRCLKEMLRTIPKHKGTERLQADIKTRIKVLSDELADASKKGGRSGPVHAIRPEGAAQVVLIGPPNAGKSSLVARLTGAHTEVGPYPFTTQTPIPGMLPCEDVHIQLVDLPPVSRDFLLPWYVNALQTADAALLVVDLSDPECLDHVMGIREQLDGKRVTLEEAWPCPLDGSAASVPAPPPASSAKEDDADSDPFRLHLPTLLVANKSDLDPDPDEVEVLEELLGVCYPAVAVSAETGAGLAAIGAALFHGLGIVRVYTKIPGHEADRGRPYALRQGGTVMDVARLVHKDIAEGLRFAKVWGASAFDGQQVGPDHPVADGDVVELHA